jgi:energy-coupling factor transporter ATP-binding protein EcfA2
MTDASSADGVLTRLCIRNFKKFDEADIELGPVTVFCGPNNSGKTTALQAIALWRAGLTAWTTKRGIDSKAAKRPGVQINRRDLVSIPVPSTDLFWHRLRTREGQKTANGNPGTRNVRLDIIAEGVATDGSWICGLEFDYPGDETIYCRPLRLSDDKNPERMPVPPGAVAMKVALLPPMSGLAASEPKWEPGRIDVLIGEGQTAQILRNLCLRIRDDPVMWNRLVEHIRDLFSVELQPPETIVARGEVVMSYLDEHKIRLDLSSAGRGLQQTLLLLAYLLANPRTVLLLDEPDAHLEILRQRQTYDLLTRIAREQRGQIIAASHSEVVLAEAASRDVVVAFIGQPHRLDNRSQLQKWLAKYPIDHLYQAEEVGWVLYLEGSTDLAILQAFAHLLGHPVQTPLQRPFVIYVANDTAEVSRHFYALREAQPKIVGAALFDRLPNPPQPGSGLSPLVWARNEIENYFCTRDVLRRWARRQEEGELFAAASEQNMETAIAQVESAQQILGKDIWSPDIKASDEVLDPIFKRYFDLRKQPLLFRKTNYHELVPFILPNEIDNEIKQKLDAILATSQAKGPFGQPERDK